MKVWIKKYKIVIFCIVVLILPFVMGYIDNQNLPQIISLEAKDILSYYGMTMSIIGSVLIYFSENRRKEKEKQQKSMPLLGFAIKITNEGLCAEITNCSNNKFLRNIHICEEQVLTTLSLGETKQIKIAFDDCNDDESTIIITEHEKINKQGMPIEILLMCEDMNNDSWGCYYRFTQVVNNTGYYYNYYNEIA